MKINKKTILAILLLTTIIAIGFSDVVFFGKTLSTDSLVSGTTATGPTGNTYRGIENKYVIDPGPFAWHHEPASVLNRETYLKGQWPLWNPYNAAGEPNVADAQSSSFYPLQIIYYLKPISASWDLIFLLRLLIAGIFTFLFMRLHKINFAGSIASAVAFMLSSYLLGYITMNHLNVEIMLPVILYFTQRLINKKDILSGIGLSFSFAFSILGGMPESTLVVAAASGAYFVVAVYKNKEWKKIIGLYAFCSFISVLLSSILWIPFLEYYKYAWHRHGATIGASNISLNSAISLIAPYFFGGFRQNWAKFDVNHVANFITLSSLIIPFSVPAMKEKRRYVYFFWILAIIVILKTYGFLNIIAILPMFSRLRFFKYAMLLTVFSFSILTGFAINNIEKIDIRRLIVFIFAWVSTVGVFIIYYMRFFNIPDAKTAAINSIGVSLIIIFSFAAIIFLYKRKFINKKCVTLAILALVIIESLYYIPKEHPVRLDPYTKPDFVKYIQKQNDYSRIYSVSKILYPNTNIPYTLYDYRGLNAMHLADYMNNTSAFISIRQHGHITGNQITDYNNLFNIAGIKYLIAGQSFNPFDQTYAVIQRARPYNKILQKGSITLNAISGTQKEGTKTIIYPIKPPLLIKYLIFYTAVENKSSDETQTTFKVKAAEFNSKKESILKSTKLQSSSNQINYSVHSVNISKYFGKNTNITFEINNNNPKSKGYFANLSFSSVPSTQNKDSQFNPVFNSGGYVVYKNKNVLPRSFVSYDYEVEKNPENLLKKLASAKFNYRIKLLLNKNPSIDKNSDLSITAAKITKYTPNEVTIKAVAKEKGLLFLSDTFYKGWNAYVNGRQKKIYKADYLYRAVPVEKGNNTVIFKYEPKSFSIALYLALAGITAILVLLLTKPIRAILKSRD